MNRSIRILRILLPILFVAFLAILGFSFSRSTRQAREVAEPVTSTMREDDKPLLESYTFEDTQTIGQRVVSRIRAVRMMGFTSGWYTLEQVHLTVYRENGEAYELSAPRAQFHAESKEAKAEGGVRISSGDGLLIESAAINFDGSRLVNRIPVRFQADEWSGRAGAVDLNVSTEHLRLFESVTATRTAAGNEPPITVTADEADFDRVSSEAVFRGNLVVDRAGDKLRTEALTARMDPGKKVLTGFEGCCGVTFSVGAGSALTAGKGLGSTTVAGERFFTDLGPAGEVRALFIQSGAAPATAVMTGPPQRTLRANQFRLTFANGSVSELEATGGARIEEAGAVPRSITGARIVASFDVAQQRPTTALIEGNLEYRDPKNRATAERGTFDFLADRAVLTSVPGVLPTLETDGSKLSANRIEMSPRSGILKAEGAVRGSFRSNPASEKAGGSGIFPQSKAPTYVNSDALLLAQKEESAHFTGNVRAWQDENVLRSRELKIEQGGETLTARGDVRALLYNAREREAKAPMRANAASLVARRSNRTMELDGDVRLEDQGRVVKTARAVFQFDAQQQLEQVDATGGVELDEALTKRHGVGTKLVYRIPKKSMILEGNPATVTDPRGTVKAAEFVFDLARNRVDVVGGESQTESTYRPEAKNE
ncbi:MAG TPA: LptA/OstA family protein [Thermoanaerobaculia bacterium]|nr:LptA/OstA family protein [Thermoanaerobaculia bacterium]